MSLNHEFLIIEKNSFSLYSKYNNNDKVVFQDDLLNYIGDSLSWIKSFNPCKNESQYGLCWCGITIFQNEQIEKFENILKAWILLFKNAPETIKLKGAYSWIVNDPQETGGYEKLCYAQQEILGKLEKLISFCKKIRIDNNKCLLHLGV